MKSTTLSSDPTRPRISPLTKQDLEIARRNGHRLINAARQGDEAYLDRLNAQFLSGGQPELAVLNLVHARVRRAYNERRNGEHMDYRPGPPQRNQLAEEVDRLLQEKDNPLAERLLQPNRAYRKGGKDALRGQFAKLYPDKASPQPDQKPAV